MSDFERILLYFTATLNLLGWAAFVWVLVQMRGDDVDES